MITWMVWMLLTLASATNQTHVNVELIEFNHLRYAYGGTVDQIIFWRWNAQYARYEVRGWIMQDEVRRIDYHTICYRNYTIRGSRVRETQTDYDPELADRRLMPEQYRQHMPWNLVRRQQ